MNPLERYREVIPDWDRFLEVAQTEEPITFRIRAARASTDEVRWGLRAQGFHTEPIPGIPHFLRLVQGPRSVARTLEYWHGLIHVQQAVMALPTLALAPRPGERVLDLCASPGGKTGHLAELMGDRGPLVAVDPSEKRMRALLGNLYRLLHPNVVVVAADGRELPTGAPFDRVLVDAPCSGQGNVRRKGGRVPVRPGKFQGYVTRLQEALLRRAVALTRPGGIIVYSTCTFAPEENERVVHRVLADLPLEVERIPLDLPHEPGLAAFEGEAFHPALQHAWRVYPHHLDSGGLFMVRLRRTDSQVRRERSLSGRAGRAPPPWTPVPIAIGDRPGDGTFPGGRRVAGSIRLLVEDFGVARADLASAGWTTRGDSIWIHRCGEWPLGTWEPSGGWRLVSVGLRAFTEDGRQGDRPTNDLIRLLGHRASRRRVQVVPEELRRLLEGATLASPRAADGSQIRGPVALSLEGRAIGRGVVGRQGLISHIPKARAGPLREILEAHAPPGPERDGKEED